MRALHIPYYVLASALMPMLMSMGGCSDDDAPSDALGVAMEDGGTMPDGAVETPAEAEILPIVFVHGGAGLRPAIRFPGDSVRRERLPPGADRGLRP